eukprot:gnl/Carplike_NY0171/8838_a12286_154.p1 GENE.gnl/Carplike_NY0171/8838_a12286_154~~gnl/Carplike_NY0171/8838_a12286_154.p1  ORF type:complete len:173 (-),score=53.07 gnl/Carplike_NY0171/8838_a12286_154:170-637(-)
MAEEVQRAESERALQIELERRKHEDEAELAELKLRQSVREDQAKMEQAIEDKKSSGAGKKKKDDKSKAKSGKAGGKSSGTKGGKGAKGKGSKASSSVHHDTIDEEEHIKTHIPSLPIPCLPPLSDKKSLFHITSRLQRSTENDQLPQCQRQQLQS